MDFIKLVLFESLPLLLLFEAVVLASALAVHRRRQSGRSRLGLVGTVVACVLMIGVQRAVVTDREALRELVDRLSRAVSDGDIQALGEGLDETITLRFVHTGLQQSRPAVLEAAHILLTRYDVNNARAGGFHIRVAGDAATVRFQSFVDVRVSSGEVVDNYPTIWKLECIRRDGRWLVREAAGETGLAAAPGR